MKKILFAVGFALVPGIATAEVPQWAAPVAMELSEAQAQAIVGADTAVRGRVYPTMGDDVPLIVREGKENDVAGNGVCMGCHKTTGQGGPQSAPVTGLPVSYFLQTMADMDRGDRQTYRPNMRLYATVLTEEETRELAEYYASVPYTSWIDVVETDMVPKTVTAQRDIVAPALEGGEEPIGQRIVEFYKNPDAPYEKPGPAYTAYVPRGSINAGQQLVTTGGDKTIGCGGCHGQNLTGMGDTPPIAGRSAIYVARQLYEYQDGTRGGMNSAVMRGAAANLNDDDIIAISAYVASRPPS